MKNQPLHKKVRRYFKAQSTVLNWLGVSQTKPFGFYIPYRYAGTVEYPPQDKCLQWLKESMLKNKDEFQSWINKALNYNDRFKEFTKTNPENVNQPRFDQDWFPGLDGIMAYTMVRELKPKLVIEIGSGHSTRWMAQAKIDGATETFLHSVDPVPRRAIDKICDGVTRNVVDEFDANEFKKLDDGDILFIDSSHLAQPGTDVDYLFTEILPVLKKGVVVHIHDIFLPYGYPNSWQWRMYNEQNMLAAILSGGDRYEVLMANAFVRRDHAELLGDLFCPLEKTAHEGSFWLRIQT